MSEDGQEYYEYVLLWPDDCFDIKQQPAVVLLQEEIGEYLFKVREESIIGLPSTYILVAGYPSSIDYLKMTIMPSYSLLLMRWRIQFDPRDRVIDMCDFYEKDCDRIYTTTTPEPIGQGTTMKYFEDIYYAADIATRISRTGFIIDKSEHQSTTGAHD